MSNYGPEFHETIMGRAFFEGTLPELVESIKNLTNALNNGGQENISPATKRAFISAYKGNHEVLGQMKRDYSPIDDVDPEESVEQGYENAMKFVLDTLGIKVEEVEV